MCNSPTQYSHKDACTKEKHENPTSSSSFAPYSYRDACTKTKQVNPTSSSSFAPYSYRDACTKTKHENPKSDPSTQCSRTTSLNIQLQSNCVSSTSLIIEHVTNTSSQSTRYSLPEAKKNKLPSIPERKTSSFPADFGQDAIPPFNVEKMA